MKNHERNFCFCHPAVTMLPFKLLLDQNKPATLNWTRSSTSQLLQGKVGILACSFQRRKTVATSLVARRAKPGVSLVALRRDLIYLLISIDRYIGQVWQGEVPSTMNGMSYYTWIDQIPQWYTKGRDVSY